MLPVAKLSSMTVSVNGGPPVSLEDGVRAVAEGIHRRLHGDGAGAMSAALRQAEGELQKRRRSQMVDAAVAAENGEDAAQWGNISAERLRSLIERIERLEEEKKALGGDIKDIYAEAKSAGFDVKVMRQLINLRKQEPAEVEEQETLLDVYRRALGM
jgi:uncharacterized protein (UPF0335 family)